MSTKMKKNSSKEYSSDFNKGRSEIFSKLDTKLNIIQNNLKTKMCKAFEQTGKCEYGKKCHYAHTKDELRKPPCMFKSLCKKKNCPYDHSDNIVLPTIPEKIKSKKTKKEIEPFIITFSDTDDDDEEEIERRRKQEEERKRYEDIEHSEYTQTFLRRMMEIGEISKDAFDAYIHRCNQYSKKCNMRDSNNDSPVPFKKNNRDFYNESPVPFKRDLPQRSDIEIPSPFKKTEIIEEGMTVKIQTIEIKCNTEQQSDKLISLLKDMKLF